MKTSLELLAQIIAGGSWSAAVLLVQFRKVTRRHAD